MSHCVRVFLFVCVSVWVFVFATELVKALVQNECTKTLSQRNVNVMQRHTFTKMQMH